MQDGARRGKIVDTSGHASGDAQLRMKTAGEMRRQECRRYFEQNRSMWS
jgi:TFIIF-interacting CTD phosphatase-like protein